MLNELIDLITGVKPAEASPFESLAFSTKEDEIIERVADEYGLQGDARKLLWVIRRIENGGPGIEFGVLNKEAMRFADDPIKSLETQARWAAGTIKKRYKGDLEEFANRWAPIDADNDPKGLNKNWIKNAKHYMEKE